MPSTSTTYKSTTGLEPRTTSIVNEHSTIWPNWSPGAVT